MNWPTLAAGALALLLGAASCGVEREYGASHEQEAGAAGEGGAAAAGGSRAEGGQDPDAATAGAAVADACVAGDAQVCGTDVGLCRQGLRVCLDGAWSEECKLEISPQPRDCASSADNDCDGTADNESASCECVVGGEPRPCEGQAGVVGEDGPCRAGSQECVFNDGHAATVWSECQSAVGPAERDRCDVVGDDSDCSGTPNDGCDCETYYPDADGDTYGAAGAGVKSCGGPPEPSYVNNDADCCDADDLVHPGAGFGQAESKCQGWDLNCDDQIDEQNPSLPSNTTSVNYSWSGAQPSACGASGVVRACATSCTGGCCGTAATLYVTCK